MPEKHTSPQGEPSSSSLETLLKSIEGSLPTNKNKQLAEATVLQIGEKSVLVDAQLKADGVISINEFKDLPNLKVGDTIKIYIENLEDRNGELIVSRKKAKKLEAWKKIETSYAEEKTLLGKVIGRVKGGLEVDINGITTFLPGSQIDTTPVTDFDSLLHQTMELAVLSINREKKNAVVSRRVLLEYEQKALIEKLEVGQVLEGTIKNITRFGVFVELASDITGLVYVKETSWDKKVTHPDQITDEEGNPLFVIGEPIKVVVKEIEPQEGHRIPRIALSTRALLPNPWDDLPESIEIGSVVKGNVTSIQDRGICVRIKEGVEGFVHISEMTLSPYLDTPASVVEPGQEVDLQVLKIEREKQDLRLGMRQLLSDPWQASDFLEKYGLNTRHQAVVRKFAEKSKGTFFEIEPGIEGYLDNDHISWVKKILRANDYFQIGEKHEIIVLSVNEESKLLKLGMRELQDSPWDSFEESFTVGSEHDGVVKNKYRSGAIIELPYGLQAFVPNKELVKEDNNSLEEGETLKFRIIDFIKYEHKVMLSHVATYKEPSTEGERVDRPPVQVVKKATLSDLGALSKLKEKLTGKSQEGEQATKEQPEEKKNSTKKTKEKENKEEDK